MIKSIIIAALLASSAHAADVVLGRISDLTWSGTGIDRVAQWDTWTPASLGPVAWYRGEQNALDSAGDAHGTWTGTPVYTEGKVGFAFSFGNTTTNKLSIPTITTSNQNGAIAFWYYTQTYANEVVIRSAPPATTYIAPLSATTLRVRPSSGFRDFSMSAPTSSWHHIVVCATDAGWRVFINGAQSSSGALTQSGDIQTGIIGNWDTSLLFRGYVDELLFFDRALTPAEITQLYNWRQ